MPVASTSSPAQLLRYRFDAPDQLERHFHVIDRRAVFFWSANLATFAEGTRILLEISFATNEQKSTLRGTVATRETGALPGYWVVFPSGFLQRWREQSTAERRHGRIATDVMVRVKRAGQPEPMLGRIFDVSMMGMRLTGVGELGTVGSELELSLFLPPRGWPTELGRGRLARVGDREAGITLLRSDPEWRKASTRLFEAAREAWQLTREVAHPALCCRGGKVLEPALPHAFMRR